MKEIKTSNYSALTVDKLVEQLSVAYAGLINHKLPVAFLPSVMLWGPPGVGKSQGVRQLATSITAKTGKRVAVTDVRLLLFNPIDLRGIPTANADKTLAVWLKPKIFDMDEGEDIVNILFLDEISAAPPSVQAAAYQITLDRTVGEHKLPDNCIVIAAGNRVTDKSVAYKMPKALANRLCHIEIDGDFTSWKSWASRNDIAMEVVGFLVYKPEYLMTFTPDNEDLAFATPRSWEMVSNIFKYVNNNIEKVYPLICGLVGSGVAAEFRTWLKVFSEIPTIDEIFGGYCTKVPKDSSALYSTVKLMAYHAAANMNDLVKIANSIRYSTQLPPDYTAALFKEYMALSENYKNVLMTIPEFQGWMNKNGRYFV